MRTFSFVQNGLHLIHTCIYLDFENFKSCAILIGETVQFDLAKTDIAYDIVDLISTSISTMVKLMKMFIHSGISFEKACTI